MSTGVIPWDPEKQKRPAVAEFDEMLQATYQFWDEKRFVNDVWQLDSRESQDVSLLPFFSESGI
jgi:hypothetical protein